MDREGRIGALDTVFYDTLIDENAASHIALGRAFPFLADDEETAARMNESDIHIDFMIGRPDLTVTGITADGERVPGARRGRLADLVGVGRVGDERPVDQPLDRRAVVGEGLLADDRRAQAARGAGEQRAHLGVHASSICASTREPDGGRSAAISSVEISVMSKATRCSNSERTPADSTFSSSREPSGWPALTITVPPGFRRSRTRSKNSSVVR